MEQFRGEKRLASEKESEKILDIIKRDIIFDGVELHMKILATKNAKNLLHKLKGREKLKECSKDEDDEYDKLAWERAIILEIELEEKQKEWEESVADFLREKALCELGKGKEIDRETSLILDRKIELTSIKFKDRKHIFALPPSAKDSELYEMSFRGLEKKARREAMSRVRDKLSSEEENKYLESHENNLKDLQAKIEKERQRKEEGIE